MALQTLWLYSKFLDGHVSGGDLFNSLSVYGVLPKLVGLYAVLSRNAIVDH
jgi:hypothetical protein